MVRDRETALNASETSSFEGRRSLEERRNRLALGRKEAQTSIKKINYPRHWSCQRQVKSLSQGIPVAVLVKENVFSPVGKPPRRDDI